MTGTARPSALGTPSTPPALPPRSPLALNCHPGPTAKATRQTVFNSSPPCAEGEKMSGRHEVGTWKPKSTRITGGPAHAASPGLASPLREALATFRSDASEHIAWRLPAQPKSRAEMTHILGNVCETRCQHGPIYYTRATASHGAETRLCSLPATARDGTLQSLLAGAHCVGNVCLSDGRTDLSISSGAQGSGASEGCPASVQTALHGCPADPLRPSHH